MEDSNSDDLPAGWTVEVKVRNNGKIDKYYYPPSSGLKFNSKIEVFRYLEKEAKKAQKARNQRISENVELEDGIAEELPPGSMKKTGISMSEDTVTRDSSAEGSTMKQTLSVSLDQSSGFQCKNKRKKEADLPRRASKRLAGIKVDEFPEIQTRSRARRNATNQSGEEETNINADKSANNLSNDRAKQFNALDGSETMSKSDDANIAKNTVEERVVENEDKVDVKRDYRINFPLKELLSDPCIAFAIQTLTGVTFEIAKKPQVSSEFKSSQNCETSASAEDRGKKVNLAGNEATNERAGSSSEKKTLDTSWMDPCIEFAIKTLTSPTIPLDSDQNPKTCFQQQLGSSNNEHSDMANFGTQKPMLNQSFEDPTQQHARNIGIGNSAGARFAHCGENRRNVC